MNAKELKELIEFLIEKDISEFELERGDMKMRMRRGAPPQVVTTAPAYAPMPPIPIPAPAAVTVQAAAPAPSAPAPVAAPAAPAAAPTAEAAEEAGLQIVRSPIVGTFYQAPSPGAPPFVKVGDSVSTGQVLCIIEAMKLMNEIEAEFSGTIVKRYVENAQPVEYGQPLFAIRAA